MTSRAEQPAPEALRVDQVQHDGIVDCPPQTSALEVAQLMADHGVHCVVVDGLARDSHGGERLVWGVVSDGDLMSAVAEGRLGDAAGQLAATEPVSVSPTDDVQRAAQLMAEHACTHLVVADESSGRPVGVISTLDVARALAWGPPGAPAGVS
jgi:CBS domain-containing protein